MGCVESRQHQANTFHVVNVNDRGQRQKEAKLEVTETNLVLHQRNRAPIRWPLRCLRRYGFDAEQFSFESGRRCPTGPGVYTFKCRKAETLFNMLQLQIQNIADDAGSREFWPPLSQEPGDNHNYLEPIPNMQRTRTASNFENFNGDVQSRANYLAPPVSPFSLPAQTELFRSDDDTTTFTQRTDDRNLPPPSTPAVSLTPNYLERSGVLNFDDGSVIFAVSDVPRSYSSSGSDRPLSIINSIDRAQQYVTQAERCMEMSYVNIDPSQPHYDISPNCTKLSELPWRRIPVYTNVDTHCNRDDEHVYANLCPDKKVPLVPPRTPLAAESVDSVSPNSGTTTTTDTDVHNRQLTYIHLDLDKGSDSSQTAPLSPLDSVPYTFHENVRELPTKRYAQIDFPKTEALAEAMRETRGDGSKRSRHHSTIGPFTSVGRQPSTLSD